LPQADRLGVLVVGPPRQQQVDVRLGEAHEPCPQPGEVGPQHGHGVLHPQPDVGRHLVVAGAGGVQLPGHGRPDPFAEQGFHGRVDVFGVGRQGGRARLQIRRQRFQPRTSAAPSSPVMMFCRASIRAWAILPRMS
jgi:hypothetical protein